jgi:hypothetical protein
MSLFYDSPPQVSVNHLQACMPQFEALWRCESGEEWLETWDARHNMFKQPMSLEQPSLRTTFRKLIEREILAEDSEYSPTHLRLLLQPIQAIASHLYGCLTTIFHNGSGTNTGGFSTNFASKAFLDEVKGLLQHWWTLNSFLISKNGNTVSSETAHNLITYHLMYLNNLVCFSEIERLSRREPSNDVFQKSLCLRVRCAEDFTQVLFHCGQVLRLIHEMSEADLPAWWPAALYRISLALWIIIKGNAVGTPTVSSVSAHGLHGDLTSGTVPVDRLGPDDGRLLNFVRHLEGVPVLTGADGRCTAISDANMVLAHCIGVLERIRAFSPLLTEVKSKLERMKDRWAI